MRPRTQWVRTAWKDRGCRWGAVLLVCALADTRPAGGQPAQAGEAVQRQAADQRPEYLVGPGDTLSLKVFGVPELTQTSRVSNSGKIHVANLGILRVDGKSVREVGRMIAEGLRQKGLLVEPSVHVSVYEYRAHPVYVLGEVGAPGQFVLTGKRWYITDLIGHAQGLTAQADPIAYLYRLRNTAASDELVQSGEEGSFAKEDVVRIDLLALSQGKAPEMNLELRGGDVLYVRQSTPEYFYVVGEVNRPGVFEFSYGQHEGTGVLRLSRAIAEAGGPGRTAKTSDGLLVRSGENGVTEQIRFDFGAVIRGAQPDWPIRANDIVFIPGSNMKTVAYGLMGLLPMLATEAVHSVPR